MPHALYWPMARPKRGTPSIFCLPTDEIPANVAAEPRLTSGVSLHSRSHAGPYR